MGFEKITLTFDHKNQSSSKIRILEGFIMIHVDDG